MVDGPGLDLELARLPSTTNMTTSLFSLKAFKDGLNGKGLTHSTVNPFGTADREAVVLQKKSDHELRMRYLS